MESYRVSDMPNTGLPQGYMQPSRSRGQSNGTYGLSIRVQGIDGHPYVVLNNQDRVPNPYAVPQNNNGHMDSESPFNYDEYDFKGTRKNLSEGPYMDFMSPKLHGGPHNGTSDPKNQSSLLNFQKHPEILKPYDPESNTLDSFRSLPSVENQNPYPGSLPRANSPVVSQARSSSQVPEASLPDDRGHTQPQDRPQTLSFNVQPQTGPTKDRVLAQPQVKPPVQAQPQVKLPFKTPVPYQTRTQPSQRLPVPQPSTIASNPSDQTKASSRPSSSVSSANSSLERSRREPDVLPLRRIDSSGPVLQSSSSRNSSMGSTTPTKEDQLDQLYAETINRHENRRYLPFLPGTGRDIDTGSIPGVDELIKKFDSKETQQRRGRSGRRNRLNPEDRKRSRSVDSSLPFSLGGDSDYLDEVSRNRGRSTEHLLRPSLLLQKAAGVKTSPMSPTSTVGPRINLRNMTQVKSAPGSPQGTVSNSSAAILRYKNPLSRPSVAPVENKNEEAKPSQSVKCLSSVKTGSISRPAVNGKTSRTEVDAQVTPDLLKGQEELSQQTNEETAKQILFSYLKDGSNDNDDTTKRKVNLVFEKIQTLKSRAAGNVQGDNKSPDLAAQARALQEQKAELEKEIADLKKQLEDESKKRSDLNETQLKVGAGVKDLRRELDQSQAECSRLRDKLSKTEADLRATVEELYQVKMEKEQYQTEIRDLQDQLSEMHDELDGAKQSQTDSTDKEAMMEDFMQLKLDLQELLLAKEEQEELLRRRERELTALKGALKEEVATHDQEVDKLREQYEKEIRKLQMAVEEAKQNNVTASKEKEEVEAAQKASEGQAGRLSQEVERLRKRAQELENEVAKLNRIIDEAKLQESRLGERAVHREVPSARSLIMNEIVEASQSSTQELQEQIDMYKDKNRKEMAELQKQLREGGLELEKSRLATKTLQEELARVQEDLRQSQKDRDEALQRVKDLEQKVFELEVETETKTHSNDKTRQIKLLEDRLSAVQMEMEEERQNGDLLLERIDRGREQLEQMRNEMMQERASRQDVECDKMSLERQNKDLKSRIAYLEGSHKPSKEGLVPQLEIRIQELEERLEAEERERGNLQLANRRLERKVKETMMQVDEEHHSLQDQKDQLNLRLKALKRQMDEAEEEIDRLEHNKKKLQRDLEEQQEVNEQLQSQLKALRSEMRRKNNSAPVLNADDDDDDDDDISTDGETYFSSLSGYKRSSSQDAILS
uniref:Cingulin-like 1 n=1 Tax=Sinocyclocheilus anshuiensis TaxID=1608454 RepID=A0A671L5L3_9TELE